MLCGRAGPQGEQGLPGPQGEPAPVLAYGSFIDTTTQTNPTPNVARPIRFNTTLESKGVSIVDDTRVTIEQAGQYNIQFSTQIIKSDGGLDTVDIWFSVNGVDVPLSNTRVTLSDRNNVTPASWDIILELGAGDYVELYWSSADTAISFPTITGITNPVRPDIPSLILTVQQVG